MFDATPTPMKMMKMMMKTMNPELTHEEQEYDETKQA